MKKLITIAIAASGPFALAACREDRYPYAKLDHVVIQELEAGSVMTEPEVELWVVMIPEGDFRDRCVANLGGTYRPDGHRYCIVPAP